MMSMERGELIDGAGCVERERWRRRRGVRRSGGGRKERERGVRGLTCDRRRR